MLESPLPQRMSSGYAFRALLLLPLRSALKYVCDELPAAVSNTRRNCDI
jgi:hypothetical protein